MHNVALAGARVRVLAAVGIAALAATLLATSAGAQTAAAAARHTVVVTPDGAVWVWGSNAIGQLGDDSGADHPVPTLVPTIDGAVAVAAGFWHTLVLRADGTVWSWGYNGSGQLGDGTTTARSTPVPVIGLPGIVAISAGDYHSIALDADGHIWAWGNNGNGQLGDGSTVSVTQPVLVNSLTSVVAIDAGAYHTLAIRSDGTAWAWGDNGSGQLGNGTTAWVQTLPVQMSGITGASAVAAGVSHSLILKSDGTAWAAGGNSSGQLGDGTFYQRTTAVAVSGLTTVSALAGGSYSSYARKADGTVWSWGASSSGRLGGGTANTRNTPGQVTALAGIHLLTAGEEDVIAVTSTGVVWVWGGNASSQLGDGTSETRAWPVAISGLDYAWRVATPAFSVAAGTYTTELSVTVTCATSGSIIHYTLTGNDPTESDPTIESGGIVTIDQTQTLMARASKAGMPRGGIAEATYALALPALTFSPPPTTYTGPQTVTMSTPVAGVTIRYTTDGTVPSESSTVYAGALSIGTSTPLAAVGFRDNWSPSAVMNGLYTMRFGTLSEPIVSPAPGTHTTEALVSITATPGATIRFTTNGSSVETYSPIYTGPISITTATTLHAKVFHPDYTPSAEWSGTYQIAVEAPTLSNPSGTYAAGQVITMASGTPGATLRYTMTGLAPTPTDRSVPTSGVVAGNFTLKVVASKPGCLTSAVVTAVYAVPTALATVRIAGGDAFSLAIRGDGAVWGWGSNGNGQVGDGSTTQRLLPVLVNGLSGAVALAAGDRHALVVRSDGTLWTWGYNGYGQLGNGGTASQAEPDLVPGFTNAVSVAGGGYHSLALRSNGTLWSFGLNSSGQLGDGTTTSRAEPVQVTTLSGIVGVSASSYHSLALKDDGTIWSWGDNYNGQLGSGSTDSRSTPGSVLTITAAIAIAAGGSHSVAVLSDGTVQAWGANAYGQLGDGSHVQHMTPVPVMELSSVVAIAVGGYHSLALRSDGGVWAWGGNWNGALGDGTTTDRAIPIHVLGLPAIATIAAGADHSLAVATDGSVWVWGRNAGGQLGDGTTTVRLTPVLIANAGVAWKLPTPMISLPSGHYSSAQTVTVTGGDATATLHYSLTGADPSEADPVVASGATVAIEHSLTLKARAWKAGALFSEVASASYELHVVAPLIAPGTGFYGTEQTVTITSATSGAILTYTLDGTEPIATSAAYSTGLAVAATRTVKARAFKPGWTPSESVASSYVIYAGTVATPTITPDGGPYPVTPLVTLTTASPGATIRYTRDGSDPGATSTRYAFPFLVERSITIRARAFLPGFLPSDVASAAYALDAAGQAPLPLTVPDGGRFATQQTVLITGPPGGLLRYSTSGIDPTESDPVVPPGGSVTVDRTLILKVRTWLAGSSPSAVRRADFMITGAIAGGHSHTLALTAGGQVWGWGSGSYGQLGNGAAAPTQETPVASLTEAMAIAAGDSHSLGVRRDGTVWAWGSNNYGELGNGTPYGSATPVQVINLTDVIAVAAGDRHSLALKGDGSVWAWGHNQAGQLGDGTTVNQSSPVQVLGLRGITSIAAGADFSLAVQPDGAAGGFVWAFGANGSGQLGDGSTLSRAVPVQVVGIADAVQVAAGMEFAVARLSDGTAVAWGANDEGQLGTLSRMASSVPVRLPVLANITQITAGIQHALAIDDEGRVWGWGVNTEVQLGTPDEWPTVRVGAPRLVPNIAAALSPAAGAWQSVLLRADGTLWGAGTWAATGLGPGRYDAVTQIPGITLVPNGWLLEDTDGDGVPNWQEFLAGLDPLNADSNGNGLSDLVDVRRRSQSANPDDDGDGVPNAVEIAQGTDPFLSDTDGDGVSDLLDDYPLDPTRSHKPAADPTDTTPPIILLLRPASARPVGGGGDR